MSFLQAVISSPINSGTEDDDVTETQMFANKMKQLLSDESKLKVLWIHFNVTIHYVYQPLMSTCTVLLSKRSNSAAIHWQPYC